jgi:hypothetical protein
MIRHLAIALTFLALAGTAAAAGDAKKEGDKLLSGMSILGNDDAPKALVIVPWKASDPGDALDVSSALDDGRQPVDRDVFMRELDYYHIREGVLEGPGSGSR